MKGLTQARSRTATALHTLAEAAREQSPGRRRIWVAVALLLTLGPVAFTLARASDFSAGVKLFPAATPPLPAERNPAVYRGFLADATLQQGMRDNAGASPGEYLDASIRRSRPRGTLQVTLSANDPERAARVVTALGRQVIAAQQRRIYDRIATMQAGLNARLGSRGTPPDAKPRLRRRLRRVAGYLPLPPTAGGVMGPAAAPPPLTRPADRLVDTLPGGFRPRPSPLAAALAGLVVALTLWLLSLGLSRLP